MSFHEGLENVSLASEYFMSLRFDRVWGTQLNHLMLTLPEAAKVLSSLSEVDEFFHCFHLLRVFSSDLELHVVVDL